MPVGFSHKQLLFPKFHFRVHLKNRNTVANRMNDKYILAAFFRAPFNEAFCQKHQAAHLHPFRNDIAYNLSPLTLGIHSPKKNRPANAGYSDENQQRMSPKKIQYRIVNPSFDSPAFCRMKFQKIFCPQNNDHGTAPIGDRIPEKRTKVCIRIRIAVADNPRCQ